MITVIGWLLSFWEFKHMYEVTREEFDKLKKKYDEYIDLYTFFNNGSAEGASSFESFYWRFTYHVKYEEPERLAIFNG